MDYQTSNPKLKSLLKDHKLTVDYEPELMELTVYSSEPSWGVIHLDDASPLPFERDVTLIDLIEAREGGSRVIDARIENVEKLAVALTARDGDTWYCASRNRHQNLTPANFGSNGRIWLAKHEELALVRALKGAGRRRVGFNELGDTIRGTLQVEWPDKINWGEQLYLYEVDPTKLDPNKVYRGGNFQYEYFTMSLKPTKVYRSTLMNIKRMFDVQPLYAATKKDKK